MSPPPASTTRAPAMPQAAREPASEPASPDVPQAPSSPPPPSHIDVLVVGAGMAGLYTLIRLTRECELSSPSGAPPTVHAVDSAHDVGGTWFWNCYPGARCDIMSIDYAYTFSSALATDWTWSKKFPARDELLRYFRHVADRFDLRPLISLGTRVVAAHWQEREASWVVTLEHVDQHGLPLADGKRMTLTARKVVFATGALSHPKTADLPDASSFAGEVHLTARWPRDRAVELTGRRVAVLGTGSSGVQLIPAIAAANPAKLTVLQRTPVFCIPAHNGPTPADKLVAVAADRSRYIAEARASKLGVAHLPYGQPRLRVLSLSDEERERALELSWQKGDLTMFVGTFDDFGTDERANDLIAEFVRRKIRTIVHDEGVAKKLVPSGFAIGAKRICLDDGYYETFNKDFVELVDLHEAPLLGIESGGVRTASGLVEADVLVFATGFDSLTGALLAMDIVGRGGVSLRDAWADGASTYLGLMCGGFPNAFFLTGPGSPSVFPSMLASVEQHVEFATDLLGFMAARALSVVDVEDGAQRAWDSEVAEEGARTLVSRAKGSWYMGGNVPGKRRQMLAYIGGMGKFRRICEDIAADGYRGFIFE